MERDGPNVKINLSSHLCQSALEDMPKGLKPLQTAPRNGDIVACRGHFTFKEKQSSEHCSHHEYRKNSYTNYFVRHSRLTKRLLPFWRMTWNQNNYLPPLCSSRKIFSLSRLVMWEVKGPLHPIHHWVDLWWLYWTCLEMCRDHCYLFLCLRQSFSL